MRSGGFIAEFGFDALEERSSHNLQCFVNRVHRTIPMFRDNRRRLLLCVEQMDQFSLANGQLFDALIHCLLSVAHLSVHLKGGGCDFMQQRVAENQPVAIASSPVFEDLVSCDAQCPSNKFAVPLKGRKASPKFQAGFLIHIIDRMRLDDDRPDVRQNPKLVSRKEPQERLVIVGGCCGVAHSGLECFDCLTEIANDATKAGSRLGKLQSGF